MRLYWKHTHGLAEGDIALRAQSLRSSVRALQHVVDTADQQVPEASVLLPQMDTGEVEAVSDRLCSARLRYIVVIGIGGSNLGTKAIYDALYGYRDGLPTDRPQMVFVDSIDPALLNHHIETLIPTIASPEEVLLVTVSKSGGTTETITNTEILLAAYTDALGDMTGRVVVITDPDSAYAAAADEVGMERLTIPPSVGGRYSVFSAVGLLPLRAAGVDIDQLRAGARDILPYCLHEDWEHNPAVQSATITALSYETGKVISDTFLFHSELESLGKWYRQLLGESIGKAEKSDGRQQPTGITPTVSIGSTDLHSVGQLYLGGPADKFTTFVYAASMPDRMVPQSRQFPNLVGMIEGKRTSDIMGAIRQGTARAYQQLERPYVTVELAAIAPYEIGAFMQWKMVEMMYLGKLLAVNPFDQPSVESYKTETKRILDT